MPSRRETPTPEEFATLEQRLGYTFRDSALLKLALTHRSVVHEARGEKDPDKRNRPGTDNEQLEFLGDAVLGLAVSELLVEQFPDCHEGELTRIRAALVSRKRLGEMGDQLGLREALLLGKSAEANGARQRSNLAANAAEAIVAAMYLDALRSGEDGLQAVRVLARNMLVVPELAAIREAIAGPGHGALRDPKTVLQERVQAESAGKLRYIDVDQTGPPHERHFTVEARLEAAEGTTILARGEGPSKRAAQQEAATAALRDWPAEPAGTPA